MKLVGDLRRSLMAEIQQPISQSDSEAWEHFEN